MRNLWGIRWRNFPAPRFRASSMRRRGATPARVWNVSRRWTGIRSLAVAASSMSRARPRRSAERGSNTRPWTAMLPLTRIHEPIFEYGCHEGNEGLQGILIAERLKDKEAEQHSHSN